MRTRHLRMIPTWRAVLSVFIVSLALSIVVSPSPSAARVQQAPSSRVAIDLPEGYEPAKLFSGFTHDGLGVSLVVLELPGRAYDELTKGLTPEALQSKGMTKVRRGELPRPDAHLYVTAEQSGPGGAYAKFIVVFRDGETTALITANVPKPGLDNGQIKANDIESMLASARLAAAAAEAKDLFALSYLGPFKPAGSFIGTAKAYTLDGRPETASPVKGAPTMLVIAPSLDQRPVANPEVYAEQLLNGVGGHEDIRILSRTPVTYGGLTGVEIDAQAKEALTGSQILLYQAVLLRKDGGYWRLFGQAPAAERERFLSEFRKIAAGFSLVR